MFVPGANALEPRRRRERVVEGFLDGVEQFLLVKGLGKEARRAIDVNRQLRKNITLTMPVSVRQSTTKANALETAKLCTVSMSVVRRAIRSPFWLEV